MEQERRTVRSRGIVTEEYSRVFPAAVTEEYVRPLPTGEAGAPRAQTRAAVAPPAPEKKKGHLGWWLALIILGVLALCAIAVSIVQVILFSAVDRLAPDTQSETQSGTPARAEEALTEIEIPTYPVGQGAKMVLTDAHGEPLSAQEVYRRVNPAAVTVIAHVTGMTDLAYVGTGVIFREDGYILTNRHILEGSDACTVLLWDESTYPAKFVASDEAQDLAILKVEARGLPFAEIGDSDELTVGDPVYAIGNPVSINLRGTMTDGIVSALNRDIRVDGRTMTLIQTNAALNYGNSGGPLINQYGQVVGINVIKLDARGENIEGLGFAIPTAAIERTVNDLLAFGELRPEPLLGLSVELEATRLDAEHSGLRVVEVTRGGAADRAGVRVGDFVLRADGRELRTSDDLLKVRRRHQVGETLSLTLWRDGETVTLTLDLRESVPEESGE